MPCYSIDGVVPVVDPSAYVHPTAVLIGDVIVGPGCYIGPCACRRGDFGRIEFHAGANVQDTCVLHSFPNQGVVVGVNGHIGHIGYGAVLHGYRVKADAVVGMNAIVMDGTVVGTEAMVGAGATSCLRARSGAAGSARRGPPAIGNTGTARAGGAQGRGLIRPRSSTRQARKVLIRRGACPLPAPGSPLPSSNLLLPCPAHRSSTHQAIKPVKSTTCARPPGPGGIGIKQSGPVGHVAHELRADVRVDGLDAPCFQRFAQQA